MVKKKIILLGLMLIFSFNFVSYVKADMGPKPTTEVEILGVDEPYYFDLLKEFDETDVFELSTDRIESQISNYYLDSFPDVLNGYQDEDGFASYTLYNAIPHVITQNVDNPDRYMCGYYSPPEVFKIVVVLKESETIYVSEIIEKEYFYSYFTWNLGDLSITETRNSNQYIIDDWNDYIVINNYGDVGSNTFILAYILQIVICVILTLLIEIFVLYLFGYKEKDTYKKVVYINLITQGFLQLLIVLGSINYNPAAILLITIVSEIIIFTFEAWIYRRIFKELYKDTALRYAIVANLASLAVGYFSFIYILSFLLSLF